MKETNFENYYDLIKDFSFKSVIINLTIDEIQNLHEQNVKFGNEPSDISETSFPSLKSIEDKINEGIDSIRERIANPSAKCFLRLSTRSPKDAIFHLKTFPDLYSKKLIQAKDNDTLASVTSVQTYQKLIANLSHLPLETV